MTFVEQYRLAVAEAFRQQVRVALWTAATQIQGEAVGGLSTAVYGKRQELAASVLRSSGDEPWLSRFAAAAAQNASLVAGSPVAVASSTNANPIVVTTATAHGFASGDTVTITGHTTNTNANGTWRATNLTTTTFSIPMVGNGVGGATGYAVEYPADADIQFTVNSIWNDLAGVTATD